MISTCPSCQAAIDVPPEAVGKKVRCTGCQAIFVIEAAPVAPAPPPPKPAPKPSPVAAKPEKKKKPGVAEMKPAVKKEELKKKKKNTDAEMKLAIKKEEPKKKPAAAPKLPTPQAGANPFDFGAGPIAAAGPAADFSFAAQHPTEQVNLGVRMRASAAASFMKVGIVFGVLPTLVLIALAVLSALARANLVGGGVACCGVTLYPIAAVFVFVGAGQLRKLRSFRMAMIGALFSVLFGVSALIPGIGLSILFGLAIWQGGGFQTTPVTLITIAAIPLSWIQFFFSTWGGIRAMLILRKPEVRQAMGTKPAQTP